jgi:hypothetical protein
MPDTRLQLMEGRVDLSRAGEVVTGVTSLPPFIVLDAHGVEIEPITAYLRDLALSDVSPLTCRSYAFDLLRWFRVPWVLGISWERATGSEADVLVSWMRTAGNYQRVRTRPDSSAPGTVNVRTGKPTLAAGYAPATINHALSVIFASTHSTVTTGVAR